MVATAWQLSASPAVAAPCASHGRSLPVTGVVLRTEYQPIPGVTIVIEGTTIGAVSDASGRFTIRGAPAGHRHLQVMGTTGNHDAVQYPTIGFEVDLLSGGLIHLPMPIYLPTMDRANEVLAGGDQEVTITIPGSTGAQVVIAPHSTIRADGVRGPVGMFTSTVNAMAIPMPAPGGSAPILVQTLQPSGTRLDPPAKVRWPNTFGLLPGAQVGLISFVIPSSKSKIRRPAQDLNTEVSRRRRRITRGSWEDSKRRRILFHAPL